MTELGPLTPATERLRQVAAQARDATVQRDRLIVWLREHDGLTLRAIAQDAGLTHAAVSKILRREAARDVA